MGNKDSNKSIILIHVLLFISIVLFLIVLSFLYQSRIQRLTLSENRFLSTEWHLLQELKAQTDRQLRLKDREIAQLWAEYRNLKGQDLSSTALRQLEAELRKAEEERAAILSLRLSTVASAPRSAKIAENILKKNTDRSVTVDATAAGVTPADTSGDMSGDVSEPVGLSSPMAKLLGHRIQKLEAEVLAYRLRAEAAERKYMAVNPGRIPDLSEEEKSAELIEKLLAVLERKITVIEQEPPPKIEDIRTRSLIRAIVSSPAIKEEYPDLLESLDKYFEAYGRQEWLSGQGDAYQFTVDTLKALRSGD